MTADTRRAQFEAWAQQKPRHWNTSRRGADELLEPGRYVNALVDYAWQAWQAASAPLLDALAASQAEHEQAMRVLAPNMPESGLVDACRQVKQAAISASDNCEVLEAALAASQAEMEQLQKARLAAQERQLAVIRDLTRKWDERFHPKDQYYAISKEYVRDLRAALVEENL